MNPFVTVSLILLATAIAAAEDPTESLPGVLDLTPSTFDDHVNGKTHALVEFYAPWCGHCKHLTPVYKKLGEQIMSDPKLKNRVVIGKVDADAHKGLGTKFGVTGFPTLKWFSRGKPVESPEDYTGGRNLESFLQFITSKLESDKGFGRVEALDSIVENFMKGDKDSAIKEVTEKMKDLSPGEKEKGAVYLKLMNKAKEKGDAYFAAEKERLGRMVDSGSVNEEKLLEFSQKISILSAFETEQ